MTPAALKTNSAIVRIITALIIVDALAGATFFTITTIEPIAAVLTALAASSAAAVQPVGAHFGFTAASGLSHADSAAAFQLVAAHFGSTAKAFTWIANDTRIKRATFEL